jgi:hypothetical protein
VRGGAPRNDRAALCAPVNSASAGTVRCQSQTRTTHSHLCRVYWIGLSSSLAAWPQFLWADGLAAPPGGSAYHHWGSFNSECCWRRRRRRPGCHAMPMPAVSGTACTPIALPACRRLPPPPHLPSRSGCKAGAVTLCCSLLRSANSTLRGRPEPPLPPPSPPPLAGSARYPLRGAGYCTASSFALGFGGASGWLNADCATRQYPAICELIPSGPRGRVVSYRLARAWRGGRGGGKGG